MNLRRTDQHWHPTDLKCLVKFSLKNVNGSTFCSSAGSSRSKPVPQMYSQQQRHPGQLQLELLLCWMQKNHQKLSLLALLLEDENPWRSPCRKIQVSSHSSQPRNGTLHPHPTQPAWLHHQSYLKTGSMMGRAAFEAR